MDNLKRKIIRNKKRKLRIRNKLSGNSSRPRITIYKSNKYIYLQAINDEQGKTLVSISNLENENKEFKKNINGAKLLSSKFAEKLKNKKIEKVIFDRNGYRYHGVVKAIAESMRESGITI